MLEEKRIDETMDLSRRDFLVKAGALTAGLAVAGGLMGSLASEAGAAPTVPITYEQLDVERVRQYALEGYKGKAKDWNGATISGGGCCFGAAYGLLKELWTNGSHADWQNINATLFGYGGGGINSWGTLCGALNGALYVCNLALGCNPGSAATDPMRKTTDELMSWYCRMPFPSATLIDGTTSAPLSSPLAKRQIQSVASSPLCHVSVSVWIKAVNDKLGAASATVNGAEKADRCARVTGDTAAKAAMILNAFLADRFRGMGLHTTDTNFCMDCHNQGALTSNYTTKGVANKNDEQGMMPCIECHGEEVGHEASHDAGSDCGSCHTI